MKIDKYVPGTLLLKTTPSEDIYGNPIYSKTRYFLVMGPPSYSKTRIQYWYAEIPLLELETREIRKWQSVRGQYSPEGADAKLGEELESNFSIVQDGEVLP